ncbi:uncharacterized [Tachysurus ichikawai]
MSAMTTNDYEYDEEEEIAVALCVSFWLCVLLDNVLERNNLLVFKLCGSHVTYFHLSQVVVQKRESVPEKRREERLREKKCDSSVSI